jgi:hypothetical protein
VTLLVPSRRADAKLTRAETMEAMA